MSVQGPVHTGNKVKSWQVDEVELWRHRSCRQSETCSTRLTLSKVGNFCRPNVKRPFDFVTSVYGQSDTVDYVEFWQSHPCQIRLCHQCVPALNYLHTFIWWLLTSADGLVYQMQCCVKFHFGWYCTNARDIGLAVELWEKGVSMRFIAIIQVHKGRGAECDLQDSGSWDSVDGWHNRVGTNTRDVLKIFQHFDSNKF